MKAHSRQAGREPDRRAPDVRRRLADAKSGENEKRTSVTVTATSTSSSTTWASARVRRWAAASRRGVAFGLAFALVGPVAADLRAERVSREAALSGPILPDDRKPREDHKTWQRQLSGLRFSAEPSRVARSGRGDIAIGDDSGVSWQPGGESRGAAARASQALQRAVLPPVRALAFDAEGVLWIGTLEGLHRWERGGRPVRRTLRGAEGNPEIHDLVVSGEVLLIATATGAYWSTAGAIFQPLEGEGIAGPITRVLLRGGGAVGDPTGQTPVPVGSIRPGSLAEAWLLGAHQLFRIRGHVTTSGLRVMGRERIGLPRPSSERAVVALALDATGQQLAIVYPDAIGVRPLGALSVGALSARSDAAVRWQLLRPVLAPGAMISRLGWTSQRAMLVTDRGVFAAPRLEGPYARMSPPVGTEECSDLDPESPPLALCRSGLYAFDALPSLSLGTARALSQEPDTAQRARPRPGVAATLAEDPPVEQIRRRALRRAGLDAARASELWTGLRKRARWPELLLRFGAAFDDDDSRDHDQAFLSGDTRQLFDRARDRGRRLDASIALDWDLGGLVYPLESVDLSRELRQVVSLRDDVADEINQLYFERQRLRARLAEDELLEPAEAASLIWRAREINAGLDAWTDGWISRWRIDPHAAVREASAP